MTSAQRQAIVKAVVARKDLSPAGKRRVLKNLGVDTEYSPHQGKREMERRVKNMARIK